MQNNLIYLILGTVMGYAIWNIVDITKTSLKLKIIEEKAKQLRASNKANSTFIKEESPLVAAYQMLTEILGMPKEKVILRKDNSSLTIAYGYSHVVAIDKHAHVISIGIGIDHSTGQSEKEKKKEYDALVKILKEAQFEEDNFARALATLTVNLYQADVELYSEVTRQIPRDML